MKIFFFFFCMFLDVQHPPAVQPARSKCTRDTNNGDKERPDCSRRSHESDQSITTGCQPITASYQGKKKGQQTLAAVTPCARYRVAASQSPVRFCSYVGETIYGETRGTGSLHVFAAVDASGESKVERNNGKGARSVERICIG